jgi:hypothetical protein
LRVSVASRTARVNPWRCSNVSTSERAKTTRSSNAEPRALPGRAEDGAAVRACFADPDFTDADFADREVAD